MKFLFVLLLALIMTGCAGTPEKSFVYKLDDVGQVSCNRGAEKSAFEQTTDALKSIKEMLPLVGLLNKSTAPESGSGLASQSIDENDESKKELMKALTGLVEQLKIQVETQTKKTDMLNEAFDVCKTMNGLK